MCETVAPICHISPAGRHILDTDREPAIDRIARLAAALLEAPYALISLNTGAQRLLQDVSGVQTREIPAFHNCSQLLAREAVAVCCRSRAAEACTPGQHCPLVLIPFASSPVFWQGQHVGDLLCADSTARPPVSAALQNHLNDLAHMVEDELRLRTAVQLFDRLDSDCRERAGKFEAIGAAVNDAILTCNSEGTILYANPAVGTVLGYDAAEFMGQSIAQLIGPELMERFHEYFLSSRRTLNWRGTQLWVRHRSGRLMPVEVSLGEFRESGIRQLALVVRDHSEQLRVRHELEAREREYRSLLENLQEVVFRTDTQGCWTFLNPAWTRLTGIGVAEALGHSCTVSTLAEDRESLAAAIQGIVEGSQRETRYEFRVVARSGAVCWVEMHAQVLVDTAGRTLGVCGTLLDIHQRRQAEERQAEARAYADQCNAAKSQFLSRVSHELRTPMNAILGFAQLLELEDLGAEQASRVQHILRGGRHLLDLLNELIDTSRIEAGSLQLNLEAVRLSDAVADAVSMTRPHASQRGIGLMTAELDDVTVSADRRRLMQVLLNLLSNAVKYNREGGTIRVWSQAAEGRIRLSVRDTGLGLTREQIARLFQPFERLEAGRTHVEGTGLGLAVSRGLVQLMHGQIGVDSEPGAGSTFWFEVPIWDGAAEAAPSQSVPAGLPASNLPSVLYIDRSPQAASLRHLLAKRTGARLIAAETGEGGFAQACEALPDLIVLGPPLPDVPTVDLVRRLRANPVTGSIPLLIAGPGRDEKERAELDEYGIEGWVEDGNRGDLLIAAVQELMERCA